MEALDQFFILQRTIFDDFGYVEDHRIYPLNDKRKYYWRFDGMLSNIVVKFALTKDELEKEAGNYYECEIYTDRYLSRWAYQSKNCSMILIDAGDGNKLLSIFDNEKEC